MPDELSILKSVMGPYRIGTGLIMPPYQLSLSDCNEIFRFPFSIERINSTIKAAASAVGEDEIYVIEGKLGVSVAFMRSMEKSDGIFIIGPWCSHEAEENISEIIRNTYGESVSEAFIKSYLLLPRPPIMLFRSQLSRLASLFRENRPVIYVNKETGSAENYDNAANDSSFWQEYAEGYIEKRYMTENELMSAVTSGDEKKSVESMRKLQTFSFENRFEGSQQRERHGLIILNTLLRKAIEKAGVHPYHIDSVSRKFADRIMNDPAASGDRFREEMAAEYARTVNKYAFKQFSAPVKETIHYINSNLDGDLSLMALSRNVHLSQSYLSNVFHCETGMTLTEYIAHQRIFKAAGLLTESDMSISSVAEKVGILDVNYFTKTFRKITGMTPSRYRVNSQKENNEKKQLKKGR